MTVLFFCWEYPPAGSGIGRYVAEMSAALREAGHTTIVATSRVAGRPEDERLEGGFVYRIFDRNELRRPEVAVRVLELARKHHVDWIEGADHWGECAELLRRTDRPPVVIKMHYNDVLLTPRYAQAWYGWQRWAIDIACWRQRRALRDERFSLERADLLLAPCRRILTEAEAQGLALPKRRAVVPNPIRTHEAWCNAESAYPTLLMIGRLDIGKGLPYVRGLLDRLLPRHPGLRFEWAGGDSYARGLGSLRQWLARQLGPMRAHVDLLGPLNAAELDEAFRRAWVVMVPSRWDTFPQVVLESMVRAKALVVSPHGGMPEMVEGTTCPVADPATSAFAEEMDRLLSSPSARQFAGESGRRRALAAYGPTRVVEEYLRACSDLCGSPVHTGAGIC